MLQSVILSPHGVELHLNADSRATERRAFLAGHMTLHDLVNILRSVVAQPVIDRTGLTEEYDITPRWAGVTSRRSLPQ